MLRLRLALIGLAAAVAGGSACGDLFHGTDWPTRCGADPCSTGGGGAASTGSHHASTGSHSGSGASGGAGGGSGGAAPTCLDDTKNGDETDVDCGGSCPRCADGSRCTSGSDCVTGVCSDGHCGCGAPNQLCCLDGTCGAGVQCANDGRCRLVAVSHAIGCGSACMSPNDLCLAAGFSGATMAYAYWLGQCGGPDDCPSGWAELTCPDWCSGTDCAGNGYCGPAYAVVTDVPAPTDVLCATDHAGNCVSDNPGYYVRALCQ